MHKISIIFVFFIIILIIVGCETPEEGSSLLDYFDMEAVEIESYFPDEKYLDSGDITISIKFSKSMNKKSVENSFSFEESGDRIGGDFEWSDSDKKMIYKPIKTCIYGKKYMITISTSAEDINGNDLKDKFEHSFQLGSDTDLPYVIKEDCTPLPNSNLDLTQLREPIIIVFSEAMEKKYPYNNITITPEIEGIYEWLDNANNVVDPFSNTPSNILRFTPSTDYIKQKYYEVNIKTSFTDLNSNSLREEYTFEFYIGDDFENPVINTIYAFRDSTPNVDLIDSSAGYYLNRNIEKDTSIFITFSDINGLPKEMNTEETETAISLTPSIPINFIWSSDNQELTIEIKKDKGVISEYFEHNQTYKLIINNSARDIYDNYLDQTYTYNLFIDGVNSQQPTLTQILFTQTKGPEVNVDILANLEDDQFLIDCSDWAMDDATADLTFELVFDTVFDIDTVSLFDNFNYASIAHSGTSFKNVGFEKVSETNYIFYVDAFGWDQGMPNPNVIVKMDIVGGKEGVKDLNNNYMEETITVFLLFEYQ